jgi:alpha-tubulin suppressor-like RCC1 family protein
VDRVTPTKVGSSQWASLSIGADHTCGITRQQTLWCWGNNVDGELGLGDQRNRNRPAQVGSDTDWLTVRAGSIHTCGTRTTRTLSCWGSNREGQLGLGDTISRNVPTQIGEHPWVGMQTGY